MVMAIFGNLGLGVQSAAAKLDVAGTVKIADGTQGAGKVFTSDANGLAGWQTSTGGGTITGNGCSRQSCLLDRRNGSWHQRQFILG